MDLAEIMLKDHSRLNSILKELESFADVNLVKENFKKFKLNLDKHFFVEEKVIFSIMSKNEEVINLIKQHKDILFLIKNIEQSLNNNLIPDFSELKHNLDNHISFENNIFYPFLEDTLNEQQKLLLMDRAQDILD
jgi:hemerythrin-like domain-containing protein